MSPSAAARMVLADDHTMFRQGLVPLLGAQPGLELVAQAGDGLEAWRLIQTLRPDVALLDADMPGLTGTEVGARARNAGFPTCTLLLTMYHDPCAAMEAQRAGMAGIISKDSSVEDLLLALRTVAAGGTFVTPCVQDRLRANRNSGRPAVPLSRQEREVVRLVALGNSSKQVARGMDISPRTVDTYRQRVMDKLGLRSLADLVRYACRMGMVS